MNQEMAVSEVRQNLSSLLKRLRKNPDRAIVITLNGIPVGELRAPTARKPRVSIGKALLEFGKSAGEPEIEYPAGGSIAEDHDQFL
ncbi:MAG: hypothetical protein HY541_07810 [Deltaproteobacteria bacterium]|nr:hypothetical protein [Deltaproteobacteria bacterium]